VEVFGIIVGVANIAAFLVTVAGFSLRDIVRRVRGRHLKPRAALSAEIRPVAMGPSRSPAEPRAPEHLVGTTGWTEEIHADYRVVTSPSGKRSWVPITSSGRLDTDFASLLRS
jgi:hypothetical protein